MQKASNQLRSNIANATRHRGDKVNLHCSATLSYEPLKIYVEDQDTKRFF